MNRRNPTEQSLFSSERERSSSTRGIFRVDPSLAAVSWNTVRLWDFGVERLFTTGRRIQELVGNRSVLFECFAHWNVAPRKSMVNIESSGIEQELKLLSLDLCRTFFALVANFVGKRRRFISNITECKGPSFRSQNKSYLNLKYNTIHVLETLLLRIVLNFYPWRYKTNVYSF